MSRGGSWIDLLDESLPEAVSDPQAGCQSAGNGLAVAVRGVLMVVNFTEDVNR